MTVRIAQVSDAHLSASRPFFAGNFERIAQDIRPRGFDFVLATGDLNLVGELSEAELMHGLAQHAAIGPELICVPGNHDVGNDPVRGGSGIATPERVARWNELAGPSAWVRDLPGWRLIAAAGTPRPVVTRLSDELLKSLAHPEVVTRLEKMGSQITPMAADEMDGFVARESSRWASVIRQRNIKPLN